MRIFKKDSEPVVVKKIAEQVVLGYIKKQGKSPWNTDVTKFSYAGDSGGGFGTGGGPPAYSLWVESFGVTGTPTSATYIQRSYIAARGGIHFYDDQANEQSLIRLNLANDPLYCLGL